MLGEVGELSDWETVACANRWLGKISEAWEIEALVSGCYGVESYRIIQQGNRP